MAVLKLPSNFTKLLVEYRRNTLQQQRTGSILAFELLRNTETFVFRTKERMFGMYITTARMCTVSFTVNELVIMERGEANGVLFLYVSKKKHSLP